MPIWHFETPLVSVLLLQHLCVLYCTPPAGPPEPFALYYAVCAFCVALRLLRYSKPQQDICEKPPKSLSTLIRCAVTTPLYVEVMPTSVCAAQSSRGSL